MSKEIIVAIISGMVGLAGGIIAWVQAVRTSRLKADADATLERIRSETSLTVERLKADQERRKKAFEVAIDESKPVEAALSQGWHDIQSIKDVISKYLSGFRFDEQSAKQSFSSAYASFCEGYAKWGTEIPAPAREAWHKAKGCISMVDTWLPNQRGADAEWEALPSQNMEQLGEIRTILTDAQMAIAASRNSVRDTVMKKILEMI